MMTRKEFMENIRNMVIDRIGDGYEVGFTKVNKLNGSYDAISIVKDGMKTAPAFDVDRLWDVYQESGIEEVFDIIEKFARNIKSSLCIDWIRDYDAVKDRLFIRISNAERNKEYIEKVPHRIVNDLALTYHIMFEQNASATVTNELMKLYGIDEEQFHKDALESSRKLMPAKDPTSIASVLSFLSNDDNSDNDDEDRSGLVVVTNKSGMYGAAAMFYPETGKKLYEYFGGEYYLLPLSVHEFLAIKKGADPEDLKKIVMAVNMTEVSSDDFLSDNVYMYDSKEDTVVIAA